MFSIKKYSVLIAFFLTLLFFITTNNLLFKRKLEIVEYHHVGIDHKQKSYQESVQIQQNIKNYTLLQEAKHNKHSEMKGNTMGKQLQVPFDTQISKKGLNQVPKTKSEVKRWKKRLQNLSDHDGAVKKYCTPETCLLPEDIINYDDHWTHATCLNETVTYLQKTYKKSDITLSNCSCSLRRVQSNDKEYHPKVALVSLPGSGNTWLRGLLEQATKICTGSMWCDPNLRATHFCGEGLRSTRTIAIKNHDGNIRWRGTPLPVGFSNYNKPEFDCVIFLHRNPYDAMVAEHNRALGFSRWEAAVKKHSRTMSIPYSHHIDTFGEEYFGGNMKWNGTIYKLMKMWEKMMNHFFLMNKSNPVLVIQYEDLKSNPLKEIIRILNFLHYVISEDLVRDRLQHQFTTFYRNHTSSFEHFTTAQKEYINSVISKVDYRIGSRSRLPLKDYLRS